MLTSILLLGWMMKKFIMVMRTSPLPFFQSNIKLQVRGPPSQFLSSAFAVPDYGVTKTARRVVGVPADLKAINTKHKVNLP